MFVKNLMLACLVASFAPALLLSASKDKASEASGPKTEIEPDADADVDAE
jgi:hypothetical protein